MAWTGMQGADEAGGILGQGVHVVAGLGHLALALASEIEGDAAIAILECRHLVIEQASVAEEPVGEDDGLWTRASVFMIDARPIDRHFRHGAYLTISDSACGLALGESVRKR